jgi:asparagine synthase (glutamine-hydrolysing)
LLDESVRMQLVSDVPVGVFLAGGIDSSSVVGILSRHGIRPSTFSIVFQEKAYSEAEHSRAVAERFRTDHHEIRVTQEDFFTSIPAALRAMDQPTMDGVNTYFVSQQARGAGVKVALSGLGGDEIFAGYSSFRTVPRMERFARAWQHAPEFVRAGVAGMFQSLAPDSDQSRKVTALLRKTGQLLHSYFLSRMLFMPAGWDRLLGPAKQPQGRVQAGLEKCLVQALELDPVNRVSYLEARCYMLNTLLRDSDVMSMAHGLEVRVPLIDHHLAKSLMSLPGAWKLNGGTPKPLLVGALRGALPTEIVHRPKVGFTMPFDRWLRGALRPEVGRALATIADSPLAECLNGEGARRVWEEFEGGVTSWSRPWALFVLRRWCELNL